MCVCVCVVLPKLLVMFADERLLCYVVVEWIC